MADIRPFAAFLPTKEHVSEIAALPYDVYSSAEARTYVAAHPHSFLAIDRAETQFPEGTPVDDPRVYEKASSMLREAVRDGNFVQDDHPYYYIYEQTNKGRTQTGVVACASIDDYLGNVIKKHENTREDKELDRIRHVDICNAQTGPIFLAYRNHETISEIVAVNKKDEPLFDFVSEGGVENRVWRITDRNENQILEHCFRSIDSIYIADGHHRCASAVKVGLSRRREREEGTGDKHITLGHPSLSNDLFRKGPQDSDYFLCVLFPDDELRIMDYNRVLKDLNGYTEEELLAAIGHAGFRIAGPLPERQQPSVKGESGLYLGGKWYLLTAEDSVTSTDPVDGLDVSVLQKHILSPLFGIGDPRTDKRIDFVGGIRGPEELEKRCAADCKAAFWLYPTSMAELFAVADAGRLMPPKSTWFEPKLLSGLFIHAL